MNLNFSYSGWRNLREIVAGIKLPERLSKETVALYEDDAYLFTADGELVRWILGRQMVMVMWTHGG